MDTENTATPTDDRAPTLPIPGRLREHIDPSNQLDSLWFGLIETLGGISMHTSSNLAWMDEDTLIYSSGNVVVLHNINTNKRQLVATRCGRRIGAIAVHPLHTHFAVCESGSTGGHATICVYTYPTLSLITQLEHGSEKGYTAASFDPKSPRRLATVGSAPDYLLIVWDWYEGVVVLRTKAFSQEIKRVLWSPYRPGHLQTCGTGHIRFWQMAATFTGLKLQGDIGKFGSVELSDISALAQFPSGKVVSGSETGELLIWDGQHVEAMVGVQRDPWKSCHEGTIVSIELSRDGLWLYSAGEDGWIKKWPVPMLDDSTAVLEGKLIVEPMGGSWKVSSSHSIWNMVPWYTSPDHSIPAKWAVHDSSGKLITTKFETTANDDEVLDEFFGGVQGVSSCIVTNSPLEIITTSYDGKFCAFSPQTRQRSRCLEIATSWTCGIHLESQPGVFLGGTAQGTLYVVIRAPTNWKLVHVCKPHTTSITSLSYSAKQEILAIGSHPDQTVFFARLLADWKIEPIGSFSLALHSSTHSLQWHPENETLLCVLDPGEDETSTKVVCCEVALPSSVTTNPDSYVLTDIQRNDWVFEFDRHIKPLVPKSEIASDVQEWETAEKEKNMPKNVEVPEPENETTQETETQENVPDNQDDVLPPDVQTMEKEIVKEPVEIPVVSSTEWKVSMAQYSSDGKSIWFSFQSDSALSRVLGQFTRNQDGRLKLQHHVELPLESGDVITSAYFYKDASGVIAGTGSGTLVIQQLPFGAFLRKSNAHEYGFNVTQIAVGGKSDRLVVSSGADGQVLMLHVDWKNALEKQTSPSDEIDPSDWISDQDAVEYRVVDESLIFDMSQLEKIGTYSWEEQRIQQGVDERKAQALTIKEQRRETMETLRKNYITFVTQTKALHPDLPLPLLEIDTMLRHRLATSHEQSKQRVLREMAWKREKNEIALNKLKDYYFTPVVWDYISIAPLGESTQTNVATFRCRALTDEVLEQIKTVHDLLAEHEMAQNEQTSSSEETVQVSKSLIESLQSIEIPSKGNHMARTARRELRAKLNQLKPDENEADPKDVQAIEHAQNNMGMYPLKSAEDFVVPEAHLVNADQRQRQMVLLQEALQAVWVGYNEKCAQVRNVRAKVVAQIRVDLERVLELSEQLEEPDDRIEYLQNVVNVDQTGKFDRETAPEKRYEFDDNDLVQFQKELKRREEAARAPKNAFGGGPIESTEAPNDDIPQDTHIEQSKEIVHDKVKSFDHVSHTSLIHEKPIIVPETELEKHEQEVTRKKLKEERNVLISSMKTTLNQLNGAIIALRRERTHLSVDVISSLFKLVMLREERNALLGFEDREKALVQALEKRRGEKTTIVKELAGCQDRLGEKLKELTVWQEKENSLQKEFVALVGGEGNPLYAALLKIFKRRVKRRTGGTTKKSKDEEEDDDFSEEESGSDDDEDSSDEEDEDEENGENIDACPPECDPLVYERVLELREKRLDHEEKLTEFHKAVEELRHVNERLTIREKSIDKELIRTRNDLQSFQLEKQRALNSIDTCIPLRLSQLAYTQPTLSNALIFSRTARSQLHETLATFATERTTLRKEYTDLKREYKSLTLEIRHLTVELRNEKQRCEEVQIRKFGSLLDLDALADAKGGGAKTAELLAKCARVETNLALRLKAYDEKIGQAQQDLDRVIRTNTERLEKVAHLTQRQQGLDKILDANEERQLNVVDRAPIQRAQAAERVRLVGLVRAQAAEIDELKAEINMLRRKGGYLYGPVQTNETQEEEQVQKQEMKNLVVSPDDVSMKEIGEVGKEIGEMVQPVEID